MRVCLKTRKLHLLSIFSPVPVLPFCMAPPLLTTQICLLCTCGRAARSCSPPHRMRRRECTPNSPQISAAQSRPERCLPSYAQIHPFESRSPTPKAAVVGAATAGRVVGWRGAGLMKSRQWRCPRPWSALDSAGGPPRILCCCSRTWHSRATGVAPCLSVGFAGRGGA
jgi:hypothetical protein